MPICYNILMKITNRKFGRNYQEIERFEAGIVLTGPEVKSIRAGRMQLEDAFVKFLSDGAYLVNASISAYDFAKNDNYDPKRSRKLLLHKKELLRLRTKLAASTGLTVAPVSCYNKDGHIKLEIALAKGRKDLEKRKLEKARDIKKREQREIKEYYN